MLTQCELMEDKVAVTVAATDGVHAVTAERLRGGRVRLNCSCQDAARRGWCMHGVRLLCLRYDDVVGASQDDVLRLEELVTGTPLSETADEVDLALAEYEMAQRALATAPSPFEPSGLRSINANANDLAEAARLLDRAIERFRRRVAGAL